MLALNSSDLSVEALWSLDAVQGLGDRFPPAGGNGAGLEDVAFAPDLQDVYLVVPAEAPAEPGEAVRFRVLRVRLPRWERVEAEYALPVALETPPAIALRPDRGELYVEYQDPRATAASPGEFIRQIRVLDRLQLHELRTLRSETPSDALRLPAGKGYPIFSSATHFLPGTDVAYERGRLIRFADATYSADLLDFYDFLSPAQKAALAQRYAVDPQSQRPRMYFAPMDAADRWALLWAQGAPQSAAAGDLYAVVDLVGRTAVGMFETPFAAADLLPDGRVVARELRPPATAGAAAAGRRNDWAATGQGWVIDPKSGARVASFASDLLAGRSDQVALRCAAPAGDVLFFGVERRGRQQLVALDAKSGKARLVEADFAPDQGTRCLFVDDSEGKR